MTGSMGWSGTELGVLRSAVDRLEEGFSRLPEGASGPGWSDAATAVLLETAERLQDNLPYFHPRYAGQMLKPPHPMARLAYALAMLINPNNHALEGGRASSAMEKEAVAELAAMFRWPAHLGHLTGGGTLANLEALWIAGRLAPGKTVLASTEAHYTHERLTGVLGLPFESLPVDAHGRLDPVALEIRLAGGDVGTVVATVGTTGLGALDPVTDLLDLKARYGFRLHADAAYGGYFTLAGELDARSRAVYDALEHVDSLVVDPHKHGLQPYGCGAVLYRDPGVGRFYRHDSPYTYFTDGELHLGEVSLECSRAGAAAVALWATQRLLPLVPGGAFARDLDCCLRAARGLHEHLAEDDRWLTLTPPDLDILVWAPAAPDARAISAASRRLFKAAAERDLHLALVRVDPALAARHWRGRVREDDEGVTCLRCCLMKPEQLDWLDDFRATLNELLESTQGRD